MTAGTPSLVSPDSGSLCGHDQHHSVAHMASRKQLWKMGLCERGKTRVLTSPGSRAPQEVQPMCQGYAINSFKPHSDPKEAGAAIIPTLQIGNWAQWLRNLPKVTEQERDTGGNPGCHSPEFTL